MHQEKPDIENYTRVNNDNQTELYVGVSSNDVCYHLIILVQHLIIFYFKERVSLVY
jgi:hypothetical protein